ncbi:hypothetical protein HHUSO_G37033 [Huso huso]|uniref:Uncharacterized protein n=1 Tax=Huso huso TaxID=61971 RepID=A0ABR0Y0F3_HUSHU
MFLSYMRARITSSEERTQWHFKRLVLQRECLRETVAPCCLPWEVSWLCLLFLFISPLRSARAVSPSDGTRGTGDCPIRAALTCCTGGVKMSFHTRQKE